MNLVNKKFPKELRNEVEKALSYYPELENVEIVFKWGVFTQHSFMLAQPIIHTLLFPKAKRGYHIIMRKEFFIKNRQFSNGRVPPDVIVGWLGHELGHVCDYLNRNSWNLMWFGFWYYFSTSFLKNAEITADYNAVKHGMIRELVISKEFGRNPAFFPMRYVNKMDALYPSIDTVKKWATEI